MTHFEIAVVGAGMAGLTCAQQLHQAGYSVVVVEKSRGLGGRLATRRLQGTHADHGVCYLKPKDDRFQSFTQTLIDRSILQIWTDTIHELDPDGHLHKPAHRSPRYASPTGFSAIGKFLATGLTLLQNQRVETIQGVDRHWQLQIENTPASLTAEAVIVAIPAPQAVTILESIPDRSFLDQLRSVQYSACITAIAVCLPLPDAIPWQAIACPHDADLGWVAVDSTKQISAMQPVFVVQSNAAFADRHLETTDLHPIGQHLFSRAAQFLPWLTPPDLLQVHRWRYAFPTQHPKEKYLTADTESPLICAGDWCGGDRVESAFLSGLAAAEQMHLKLQPRSPSENRQRSSTQEFWHTIQ
ncbi:MAG: NAD(P)-binding protein [Leptolyngbyaceae cyanobacterium CSU_1_3]|nr:NAD(P)-binding protein [Leptolyngbyaceae cyanobacterium CSU_1_3]